MVNVATLRCIMLGLPLVTSRLHRPQKSCSERRSLSPSNHLSLVRIVGDLPSHKIYGYFYEQALFVLSILLTTLPHNCPSSLIVLRDHSPHGSTPFPSNWMFDRDSQEPVVLFDNAPSRQKRREYFFLCPLLQARSFLGFP